MVQYTDSHYGLYKKYENNYYLLKNMDYDKFCQ